MHAYNRFFGVNFWQTSWVPVYTENSRKVLPYALHWTQPANTTSPYSLSNSRRCAIASGQQLLVDIMSHVLVLTS